MRRLNTNFDRTPPDAVLLRAEEVAELLGVSRAKAYRLMKRRQIPVITFGKSVRCPLEPLLRFLNRQTEQPTGVAAP